MAETRAAPASPPRWVFAVVVAAGLAVRLWQYAGNPSFWIDELALVDDVLHMPLRALLTGPLPLDQIAPPGFLAALKASAVWLGTDERALRAFPFACSLAAVLLFAAVARRALRPWTALLAAAIFSLLPLLISWTASVKQYSTDVAASLVVVLAALRLLERRLRPRDVALAAAAGVVAPWLSHPAAFVVAGCGAAVVGVRLRDRDRSAFGAVVAAVLAWAVSAGGAVQLARSILSDGTRDYMARFWAPALPDAGTLALVALGAVLLACRGARIAVVLLAPVALTLAAAGLHAYPFSGRAVLFLVPIFVLAAAEALALLVGGAARLGAPRPIAAAVLVAALLAAFATNLPVYQREEVRPVLRRLAQRLEPGDALYVIYGAKRAFSFYAPRAGIPASRATLGGCHRGDRRGYLRELDAFRGSPRVWVLIAHPAARLAEAPVIRGYLERIGTRRETIAETGASAELFDLSDPGRLSSAAAETVPIPAVAANDAYGCANGPIGRAPWE
ncbi:MAG TPA: glycosyltransferase family 39 protein [Thermoanaerobaculia bacterium]|nr:glycosyltransferase family 39 protein [Thermoanaerobaculia bacterium]